MAHAGEKEVERSLDDGDPSVGDSTDTCEDTFQDFLLLLVRPALASEPPPGVS